MSYEPSDDEVKEALSRTHFDRYRYFLAVAAQTREIWGFGDGEAWATIDDESGKPLFCPLWPAAVYVQMWVPQRYQHMTGQALPLEDMLGDVLPDLQNRKIEIAVFMTPENVGSIKSAAELIEDLSTFATEQSALANYGRCALEDGRIGSAKKWPILDPMLSAYRRTSSRVRSRLDATPW